jgi:hypothetical protein
MGTNARDIPDAFVSRRCGGPVLHVWLHLGSHHAHAQTSDAGVDGISSQGAVDAPEALASIGLTTWSMSGKRNGTQLERSKSGHGDGVSVEKSEFRFQGKSCLVPIRDGCALRSAAIFKRGSRSGSGFWNGVSHGEHQPIGGGVEHEAD